MLYSNVQLNPIHAKFKKVQHGVSIYVTVLLGNSLKKKYLINIKALRNAS